ncbi:MAG: CCA tRNA nucleotidyltransferase [Spirochaetota bacterium]
MKRFPLPKKIKHFASLFHQHGYELYVVGGSVRDYLLGIPVTDYDFCSDARPEEVKALFRSVIPTGIEHGTVTVLFEGEQFEVTTFRTEAGYSDSRHPDEVAYVSSLAEDLSRRDFTINALAADTATGEIVDLHEGWKDLQSRRIRAIGEPRERFTEDSLRILRGYRFLSSLECTFEAETREAARELAPAITKVSGERIRDELEKIIAAKKPSLAFFPMYHDGVLAHILPELTDCAGVGQKGSQGLDVTTHSILACDGAPRDNRRVRWAALLHDIGKSQTEHTTETGDIAFHRHEFVSAQLAEKALSRLKFSNRDKHHIVHLITHHMFNYTPEWSDAAVRRFIARVGSEYVQDLVQLRFADAYGTEGRSPDPRIMNAFIDRVSAVLQQEHVLTIQDLAVNGNDLMAAGIPQGREIGVVLSELLETVLDDPTQNTKEQLLRIAKEIYQQRIQA